MHLLAISKTKSPIGVILGEVKFLWSLKTQGGGLRLADAVQGQAAFVVKVFKTAHQVQTQYLAQGHIQSTLSHVHSFMIYF